MNPKDNDLPCEPSKRRDQHRQSIFLAAVIRAGAEQASVKIRNMSTHGAMVESPVAPSVGASVDLIRGALVVRGTVTWSSAIRFGLHFSSEVSVKDWLAAPSLVQQQRVDEMIALVKSGAPDPAPTRDPPSSASSVKQLAEDLVEVVRLMQALENELASSDDTLERHGTKLQNLDIAMQMLRAIAGELAPSESAGVAGVARLDNLRVACAQALAV